MRHAILAGVVALALGGCEKVDRTAGAAPVHGGGPVEAVPPAPDQVAAPVPTPVERLMAAKTLGEALSITVPSMEDARDDHSDGTMMLALWASMNMSLSDVKIATNETSFKRVKKDSDAERGKRMCVSGNIIQIAKTDTGNGRAVYVGLLMTSGGDLISYFAAASTGDLVEESRAKFCGVVTGRYDYANSGGGTGHAIAVVGVFDIAENR